MSNFSIVWEHPLELPRPTTFSEAMAVLDWLRAHPSLSQPLFPALAEMLLAVVPMDRLSTPTPGVPATDFLSLVGNYPYCVLQLDVDPNLLSDSDVAREATQVGLCLYQPLSGHVSTPWGTFEGPPGSPGSGASGDIVRFDAMAFHARILYSFVQAVAPGLVAAGFVPKAGTGRVFARSWSEGEQEVRLRVNRGGWCEVELATRHVQVVRTCTLGMRPDAAMAAAWFVVPLHRLAADMTLFNPLPEEADEAPKRLAILLQVAGLPMLDGFRKLAALNAAANSTCRQFAPAHSDALVLQLALARLTGDAAYNSLRRRVGPPSWWRRWRRPDLRSWVAKLDRESSRVQQNERDVAQKWLLGFSAQRNHAIEIHRRFLRDKSGAYAAYAEDWQCLIRHFAAAAEPHGFRLRGAGLTRPVEGGEQRIHYMIPLSNAGVIPIYVTYGLSVHAVDQVYQRAMKVNLGGDTWSIDPFFGLPESEDPRFPEPTFAALDCFAETHVRIFLDRVIPMLDSARSANAALWASDNKVKPYPAPPIGRDWAHVLASAAYADPPLPPIELVAAMLQGEAAFKARLRVSPRRVRESTGVKALHAYLKNHFMQERTAIRVKGPR